MDENKATNGKPRRGRAFGRAMALLGITLLCLVLTLLGIVWVFEKGPSPTLTGIFCNSVRETSILRWMSRIYLSEEELEPYILKSTEDLETEQVNTSLIHIASPEEKKEMGEESEPYLQLVDIAYGTCKGKLLIVRDPWRVTLGVSGEFGGEARDGAGAFGRERGRLRRQQRPEQRQCAARPGRAGRHDPLRRRVYAL